MTEIVRVESIKREAELRALRRRVNVLENSLVALMGIIGQTLPPALIDEMNDLGDVWNQAHAAIGEYYKDETGGEYDDNF